MILILINSFLSYEFLLQKTAHHIFSNLIIKFYPLPEKQLKNHKRKAAPIGAAFLS